MNFPCVIRFEDGKVFLDVPSIRPFVEMGAKVTDLTTFDEYVSRVEPLGHPISYRVTFNPDSNVPGKVEVVSWENVHPDDWSPELRQVNDSYESVM